MALTRKQMCEDSEVKKASGASDDVQELRQQLRQLTDELHLLRKNLRSVPENLLPFQSAASGALSLGNLHEYATSEHKPPLPPRLYKPKPPPKPQRTYQLDSSPGESAQSPEGPVFGFRGPILPLGKSHEPIEFPQSPLPPKLPPKSSSVIDRMRPHAQDTNFLFKASPVLVREGSSGKVNPLSSSVGNLSSLGEPLSDNTLLKELEFNFSKGISWQNVGPVSLFLNPFNDLGASGTLSDIREAPVPLQAIAQELHSAFHNSDTSQSIVFSGERGSGKTYLSMQLLRELFCAFGGATALESDVFLSLSAATTVARSFSRAKTSGNYNSNQIGFLYELHMTDGIPCKSRLFSCFTDLKRITKRNPNDGNFKIFYEMLAGLTVEEKEKYHLHQRNAEDFVFLQQGNSLWPNHQSHTGRDRVSFLQWKTALSHLGIPFSDVIRLISSVLLLGNVTFEDADDGSGEVEMLGQKDLEAVAALLGLSGISLYKALTRCVKNVKGQQVKTFSNAKSATNARDSLARTLYYRCVSAVIRRANSMKNGSRNNNTNTTSSGISSSDGESSIHDSGIGLAPTGCGAGTMEQSSGQHGDGVIAVLDLFGFSDTESHIQRSLQIMADEGVEMMGFDFQFYPSNDCLDLLLYPRNGLLFLLDEEAGSNQGSVQKFLQNMKQHHKTNRAIEVLESNTVEPSFVLHHYGDSSVKYYATEFVETNRDELSPDIVMVFAKQSCNFGFAAYLFSADVSRLEVDGAGKAPKQLHHRVVPACGADILSTGHSLETFSQDFAQQIDHFLKSIGSSRVRFIHCANPNKELEYRKFDSEYVLQQIQRLDVLPTAQLLSAGLPYCVSFEEFNNRYRFLAHRYNQDTDVDAKPSEETKIILDCYLKAVDDSNMPYTSNQWVSGKKHVFLSQGAHDQLESFRRSSALHSPPASVSNWLHKNCSTYIPDTQRRIPMVEDWKRDEAYGRSKRNYFREVPGASPPALPSMRNYSVHGDRRVHFPQRRVMTESYRVAPMKMQGGAGCLDDGSGVELRSGDRVTVVGKSSESKHLILNLGPGKTCTVPSTYTRLSVR